MQAPGIVDLTVTISTGKTLISRVQTSVKGGGKSMCASVVVIRGGGVIYDRSLTRRRSNS